MKLLLVEDSPRLRRSLSEGLRHAGYVVDLAEDGEVGRYLAHANEYDVVILDIMLPKLDGMTLLRQLRHQENPTHILMLTARDTLADRVAGLQAGADDYLVKPFAFEELLARVQALCRRQYGRKHALLRIADLEVDQGSRTARRRGQKLDLTAHEYALLEYLALRQGEVVKREDIEKHIYDDRTDPMSNVVDRAVCMLRRKIALPGTAPLIHTRRGQGYQLAELTA